MRTPALVIVALVAGACGGGSPAVAPPTALPTATATATAPVAAATSARTPTPAPTPSGPRLRYVAGSTKKVEQIIGDVDVQTGAATASRTQARYGLIGTDLGQSFEHNGLVWFLFGDAMGTGGDPIGFSRSTDPAGPLVLDLVTDPRGRYLHVAPDGKPIPPFEVPAAGISLGGTIFVTITKHSETDPTSDFATVTRYDEASKKFTTVRELSRLPQGHFVKQSLRIAPDGLQGLPPGGPHVLMFGTGEYRKSDAYLAVVPVASFGTTAGTAATRYYAGPGPQWSEKETDAVPIVAHKTMGDISVVHAAQVGLWIMTYDSRDPRGILLRTAPQPWGPWSEPQILFSGDDAQKSGFIYDPKDPRIKPDPVAKEGFDPKKDGGAPYAPYQIERFMRLSGDTLTIEWLLSTWIPYVVFRMRSQLKVER